MYLRITERRNKDGSTVAYYALAENIWNAKTKRSEARVIYNFGRAEQVDREALKRLVHSINRVLEPEETVAAGMVRLSDVEMEWVCDWGIVLAARHLWEDLGIGEAIRRRVHEAGSGEPHETALFGLAIHQFDEPGGKPAGAPCCLTKRIWLPEAAGLKTEQFGRAIDFLAACSDEIERETFLKAADLFRLDVDLIFYGATTACFGLDEADEHDELWAGRLFATRQRRVSCGERQDKHPQVIVALAVTRDGMPVRSWVLLGDTADAATVARIKQDLRAWRLGRCVFVGDAGMYSADNLEALSRSLGRYILVVPMRKLTDIAASVLKRPGRYKRVADNLMAREVWVGKGEHRRRYVLCLNPEEAERQRRHRETVLAEIETELALAEERGNDHTKAASDLIASSRYGRYLSAGWRGRPMLDAAKVKAAAAFDGRFVITSNDDNLSAEDLALGYKGAWIIETCFRRLMRTGLQACPMFHWSSRRIVAHIKLCVLALQMQRAAEIRCGLPWARIADRLATLKAVCYRAENRTIVQRTKITDDLAGILKKLRVPTPKQVLTVTEPAPTPPAP